MWRAPLLVMVAVFACKQQPLPPGSEVEILPDGADLTFPSEPPVIATHSGGGNGYVDRGGIAVWADGSVRYMQGACTKHPRRGRLPPARVAELLAAIDKLGVFAPDEAKQGMAKMFDEKSPCADGVSTSLSLRSASKDVELVDHGCGSDPGETYRHVSALIAGAVGRGPC